MATDNLNTLKELYDKSSANFGFDFVFEGDNEAYNAIVFIESLRKENFKLSDLGISARILNHWKNNNLLPVIRGEGWNRFSFLEYIWLKIVISLRDFGFPLQNILKVKEWVFRPISKDEIATYDNDYYQRKFDESKIIYGFNNLAFALANMLLFRKPFLLIILQSGESVFVSTEKFQGLPKPYISIPLLPLVKNFIQNPKNIAKIKDLQILNKKEQDVIEIIRSGEISELSIELKENDILSFKAERNVHADLESRFLDVTMNQKFANFSFSIHKGQVRGAKLTIKKIYD